MRRSRFLFLPNWIDSSHEPGGRLDVGGVIYVRLQLETT